jgi:CubicO group peptidase (beta-lactamase class C family)
MKLHKLDLKMNNYKVFNPKTFRITIGLCLAILVNCYLNAQDDWKSLTPEAQNLNKAILTQLNRHIKNSLPHIRSLLIARHGFLVYEEYYNGASKDEFQNIQSMTKSIMSALNGIAIKDGYIKDLNKKVIDYFPEYKGIIKNSSFCNITIKHLLTMSSGIDEGPPMSEINIKSVLSQELIFESGSEFKYSSPSSHLLSGILQKATGKSVLEYAENNLLKPLGIKKITWYKDKDGLPLGCGSSLWRARDILKIGQLYLDKGLWHGKQIISSAFINESQKTHIIGNFYGAQVKYGYLWWIDLISKGYTARGFGDQYLHIIPDLDLVILCTSDSQQAQFAEHIALVKDYIIPATNKKTENKK